MSEPDQEKNKFSAEEMEFAALGVLDRSAIAEDRKENVLYAMVKFLSGEMTLETFAQFGNVTQSEAKSLASAAKRGLDKNRAENIPIVPRKSKEAVGVDQIVPLETPKERDPSEEEEKSMPKKSLPLVSRIPEHWAGYPIDAVNAVTMEYRVVEQKEALRSAITDIFLNGKTPGEVMRESDLVKDRSLRLYSRRVFDDLTYVLGLSKMDPKVKCIASPTSSYKDLKAVADANKINKEHKNLDSTLPVPRTESANRPPRPHNKLLPSGPLPKKRSPESSSANTSSTVKRARDGGLFDGNMSSPTLFTLSQSRGKKNQPDASKEGVRVTRVQMRKLVEDQLCGRYAGLPSLVDMVTSIVELDAKLERSGFSVEQLMNAYQFCAGGVNLDKLEVVEKKNTSEKPE